MKTRRQILRTSAALLASVAAATGFTACSSSDQPATSAKSDKVHIVTSTQIWADVAKAVVQDDSVQIDAILTGNNIDPHGFEPSAADMAKAEKAQIIIAGGGGYDSWLYSAVDKNKVIHALPLTEHNHDHGHEGHDHGEATATPAAEHDHAHEGHEGHDHGTAAPEAGHEGHDHAHEGHDHGAEAQAGVEDNEHIWYDLESVERMATDIANAVTKAKPDAKVDAKAANTKIEALHDRLHHISGADIAQTHPLGDHLVAHTDLHDVTPAGYRKTTLSESEPAAADINEFLQAIEAGKIGVLLDSPQTQTEYSKKIRAAAEAKHIPVVDIYETPEKGTNFFDMYDKTITELEKAVKSAPQHAH